MKPRKIKALKVENERYKVKVGNKSIRWKIKALGWKIKASPT